MILVWVTRKYGLKQAPNGVLFDMGEPLSVAFYAEGRLAGRDDEMASIDSGIPTLREMTEAQGPVACRALDREVARAMELLPT